ncbi:MAG TPA: Wzz/FepE/Etk N-terminal domain-containing protein [Burkholderiaceae bacterium]|nr:Wzz/FepE/Etk N-terminal domain-containing protein [Burkholderiaceae bacterium]
MDELLHQVLTALRGMWRRRWVGLAVTWVVALIGAVTLLRMPDRYEATARVFVDTQTVLKPLMSGLAVQPNVDEQISMLARTLIARPNLEKIMRSADLDVAATTQLQKDRIVDDLSARIKFIGTGRENLYSISYQDTNPDRAKRVVQDLLSLFVESGVGNKRRDSEAARRFIDEQIKGYEKKLEESENRVKEFKIKNVGFTGATGQDYFSRMAAMSDEVQKLRLELRAAEESRDALKRELVGEDPILLPPDAATPTGAGGSTEFDARIREQQKLLDELMRRYTDQHPDVVATKHLIASLEEQKKQELDARRKVAAQNPAKFSASTNPVFQQIKVSLADAEANVAALRARVSEGEARLAQLKAIAGRAPQVEAEMAQLNRDYDVLRKNYEQLVSRRESASIAEDVDSTARMADFRIIDPPRISPKAVFPNRLALVPIVLLLALAAGMAASLAVSQILPTFHDARQLRGATKRAVLGTISLQATQPVIQRARRANLAFGGGLASLLLLFGSWITWVALAARA